MENNLKAAIMDMIRHYKGLKSPPWRYRKDQIKRWKYVLKNYDSINKP